MVPREKIPRSQGAVGLVLICGNNRFVKGPSCSPRTVPLTLSWGCVEICIHPAGKEDRYDSAILPQT